MSNQKKLKSIVFTDGIKNQISFFNNTKADAPTLLILPALGVKASYYDSFAQYLSENGYHVVSMDWRGLGHSSVRASRKINFGYKDFIQDIDEVITFIKKELPDAPSITLVGHSLGGQLGCLYNLKFPNITRGMIAIAACSIHHTGWSGRDKLPIFMAGMLFNPIAAIVGHLPGKQLGFGGREFRGVINDWTLTLRTGKYIPKGDEFDYEAAMSSATFPILAISVENDFMAPHAAVENLLAKFPLSQKKHLVIPNSNKKLNHFRWTKIPETVFEIINNHKF